MADVAQLDLGGPVLPVTGEPNDDDVRAARRAVVLHQRKASSSRCRVCGWWWRVGTTGRGRSAVGCFRRRQALDVLDVAGLLGEEVASGGA